MSLTERTLGRQRLRECAQRVRDGGTMFDHTPDVGVWVAGEAMLARADSSKQRQAILANFADVLGQDGPTPSIKKALVRKARAQYGPTTSREVER